ncbi:TPR-like protein, partial [Rhizopus microsporus var. microsporus]
MILTDDSIQAFKVQLQQSIIVCSERGLFYASKWAAEVLNGIKDDFLDDKVPFTQNEVHIPTISTYHTDYESSLPPLSERDYNLYQYAKTLFNIRHFHSVMDVLGQSKHPKLYFLRLYAKYLAGEKRKEEFSQDVLGATEQTRADNAELESIYRELHEDYEHGRLDAFGLYLYGIVLKKRQLAFRAAAILLESIRKYQYNWSAWVELATLVQTKKMFMDLRALLNREFETSVMKEFFLAKLCIDLNQPGNFFKDIMDPLDQYFSRSAYVLSQWATFYYDSMDYNESLVLFEELRNSYPSRLDDMDVFSNLLYLQNLKHKLCTLALECEKIDKYRPETCCVRGNYCVLKHETAESVEYFKRAIKLNRSYHLAWTLLGHSYFELQDLSAAIECYRRAVEVNNRDYRSWFGLGQVYEVMKYPYDALYYYHKATNLRPRDSRMWAALSGCYEVLKQHDEALNYKHRAEACDRLKDRSEMVQIAEIFKRRGRLDIAIDFYHKIWQRSVQENAIDEITADISIQLARYAMSKNQLHDAEQYAITSLNMSHPYHEQARDILDEIGRLSKASV